MDRGTWKYPVFVGTVLFMWAAMLALTWYLENSFLFVYMIVCAFLAIGVMVIATEERCADEELTLLARLNPIVFPILLVKVGFEIMWKRFVKHFSPE